MADFRALCFLCFLLSISTVSCFFGGNTEINLKKLSDVKGMTSKQFHDLNIAHVLFNYATGVKKEELQSVNEINNLQYSGNIQVGYAEQMMNVIFDPSMADVLLLSSSHKDCGFFKSLCKGHNKYDEAKSFKDKKAVVMSWQDQTPTFDMFKKTVPISGHLVFDQVKLSDLIVPTSDCIIGVVESGYLYGKADGIVGIGRQDESYFSQTDVVSAKSAIDLTSIREHSFAGALSRVGSSKIGLQLYKEKKTGAEIGQVIFKAEKEGGRFKGSMAWFDQPKGGLFWRLPVTKITIKWAPADTQLKGTVDVITPQGTQGQAIVDPGTSVIAGPKALIDDINAKVIHGMERFQKSSAYETVEFDCQYIDKLPNIIFNIAGKDFLLEPRFYVRELKGSSCTSGFLVVPKLESLILGDTFIQKYFVVFDNAKNKIGLAESKK